MKRTILKSFVLLIVTASTMASFSQTKGTFTDSRDGQTYKTVKIGKQVWMAENLAYLPEVSPASSGSDPDPYYYVYGYEGTSVGAAKATKNYQTYGVLYNWSAALDCCPSGWHLPDDEEWKELEIYLGMSQSEADAFKKWRGTDEGGKLKETGTSHWKYQEEGNTNESGFSALPGGYRDLSGSFYRLGSYGTWWSSTAYTYANAMCRSVCGSATYNGVYRASVESGYGNSVRCVRD